jgi:hypothetical protein
MATANERAHGFMQAQQTGIKGNFLPKKSLSPSLVSLISNHQAFFFLRFDMFFLLKYQKRFISNFVRFIHPL